MKQPEVYININDHASHQDPQVFIEAHVITHAKPKPTLLSSAKHQEALCHSNKTSSVLHEDTIHHESCRQKQETDRSQRIVINPPTLVYRIS